MAKTKNAFALADFDEKKILSRKFFASLNLPENFSDEEILKDLQHRANEFLNADDTGDFFNVSKQLAMIEDSLEKYRRRIDEHINKKLLPYSMKLIEKFRETSDPHILNRISEKNHRAKILSDKYAEIAKFIIDLKTDVKNRRESIDSQLNKLYRQIFAKRAKQARKSKKLTQNELAKITEINQSDVAGYESSRKTPSFDNLIKLCRGLEISADWVLGLTQV